MKIQHLTPAFFAVLPAVLFGFSEPANSFNPTDFERVLNGGDCTGCDLIGANFEGLNLSNTKFSGGNFSGHTIQGSDLIGANFEEKTSQILTFFELKLAVLLFSKST